MDRQAKGKKEWKTASQVRERKGGSEAFIKPGDEGRFRRPGLLCYFLPPFHVLYCT